MRSDHHETIDLLVQAVIAAPKYRQVSPDLVRRIVERELAKARDAKTVVKATKNALHQASGAYLPVKPRYAALLERLRATAGDRTALRAACREAMRQHASTAERLALLDDFYRTVFDNVRPIRSLLDLGCGLHPLAIPWMGLDEAATYHACDISADMMSFVAAFFPLSGLRGTADVCDLTDRCPAGHVDVALLLKCVPSLDHLDRSATGRLLDHVDADHVVISFPVATLGGRARGTVSAYESRFAELSAGRGWSIHRYRFATELVFVGTR